MISFKPKLLEEMKRVKFPITIRSQVMDVDIERDQVTYSLRKGTKLTFKHIGEEITLEKSKKITRNIE